MSLQRLWAPWRQAYIASTRRRAGTSSPCLFCVKGRSQADRSNQVLARAGTAFLLLNLYPYNNGHLLIAPYRHVGKLESLTEEEWLDILRLTTDAIGRLKRTMHPDGFNLGINLGRVAGAGIPGHLHLHLVPRWNGDTNFMPTLAQTKVISQSLDTAYDLLRRAGKRSGSRLRGRIR